MIKFNEKRKTLTLEGLSASYSLYINDSGYLERAYLGKTLKMDDDLTEFRNSRGSCSQFFDNVEKVEKNYPDNMKADNVFLEFSPHGVWSKNHSPIVLKKSDGSYGSDFLYQSHQIFLSAPTLPYPMPSARGENAQTVAILFKDVEEEIYVTAYYTVYDDKDIFVRSFKIENKTKEPISILRALSLEVHLSGMDYDLVHFGGRWAKERDYFENPLTDGVFEVSTNLGRSSHDENPFVYLKEKNATFDRGEVIGFNLIYSGNFKFKVECGQFRNAKISYGMNDEDFEWKLKAGESFFTPQAVISYSFEGVDKMSQNFHRFIKEDLISYKAEREYKPILFNSWEGCYFKFDTESVISYIDDALTIGTEIFVLDDGWFGSRNDDDLGLGDWFVNKDKIDLHRIMNHCREKGIKFGIWFEPEMVNPNSDLFKAHPEYALGKTSAKKLSLQRHQLHLDFANPEVVDNIYGQMKAFLDEYPVDYIKWDHNRTVGEHYSEYLGKEGQGEVYHRLVLGYYDLLSRLTNEYPNIMFEGCASGGGRFDMGTLHFCPQIWASDESDPAQRLFINFNTSLGYPLSTVGAHVNDSKVASYSVKAKLALFGAYGYEMNPNILSKDERKELSEVAQIYKKYHREVIENGTLYHLSCPTKTNVMCMQTVSEDRSRSLVLHMNKLKELETYRFLKLKGLDEKAYYENDLDGKVYSGEYYMNVGLNLTLAWLLEFSCRLITLTKVEK